MLARFNLPCYHTSGVHGKLERNKRIEENNT